MLEPRQKCQVIESAPGAGLAGTVLHSTNKSSPLCSTHLPVLSLLFFSHRHIPSPTQVPPIPTCDRELCKSARSTPVASRPSGWINKPPTLQPSVVSFVLFTQCLLFTWESFYEFFLLGTNISNNEEFVYTKMMKYGLSKDSAKDSITNVDIINHKTERCIIRKTKMLPY